MSLPVLKLSGVDYGLKMLEAGMPAALVVEKPADYAGKQFRFAQGDGFRAVTLGESAGPFTSLMGCPPYALRGLDCSRLRELGEARELYLVEITEAVRLHEEGEGEPEGGMHWHELNRDEGKAIGGEPSLHRHVYLIDEELELEGGAVLPPQSLIFTEPDGDHEHAIAEDGNRTEEDGQHAHRIIIEMPEGDPLELTTENDGSHPHQLMVARSGLDGLHGHALTIGGRALTSLTPANFAALAPAEGDPSEEPPPAE